MNDFYTLTCVVPRLDRLEQRLNVWLQRRFLGLVATRSCRLHCKISRQRERDAQLGLAWEGRVELGDWVGEKHALVGGVGAECTLHETKEDQIPLTLHFRLVHSKADSEEWADRLPAYTPMYARGFIEMVFDYFDTNNDMQLSEQGKQLGALLHQPFPDYRPGMPHLRESALRHAIMLMQEEHNRTSVN